MQRDKKNPDLYRLVSNFHRKYKLDRDPNNKKLQKARIRHMKEELTEYVNAVNSKDRLGQLDALVDLIYVALGTAYYENFKFNDAFDIVHKANMKKIRKATKRSQWDVVKPAGWKTPNIKECV